MPVTLLHRSKQAVRPLPDAEQTPVEAHPLGTPQGRSLQIVGTFHNRDAQLFDAAVAVAVLKRREQDGIGMQLDDTLDVRVHADSTIYNLPLRMPFNDLGQLDIAQVAYTSDGIDHAQIGQQSAMYRGIDQRLGQRRPHDCSLRQIVRQGIVFGHQHVGVQRPQRVPRIAERRHGVAGIIHHHQVLGMTQIQRVTPV